MTERKDTAQLQRDVDRRRGAVPVHVVRHPQRTTVNTDERQWITVCGLRVSRLPQGHTIWISWTKPRSFHAARDEEICEECAPAAAGGFWVPWRRPALKIQEDGTLKEAPPNTSLSGDPTQARDVLADPNVWGDRSGSRTGMMHTVAVMDGGPVGYEGLAREIASMGDEHTVGGDLSPGRLWSVRMYERAAQATTDEEIGSLAVLLASLPTNQTYGFCSDTCGAPECLSAGHSAGHYRTMIRSL